MQNLSSLAKAITGVMLIIVCSMISSYIIFPQEDLTNSIIPLQSNWQIQGLFLISLLCGPRIGTISAITYIFVGLFYLPIFQGGGSVGYILTTEFGYLLGFIPAAWTCGYLAMQNSKANLIDHSLYTAFSLCIVHLLGIIYLVVFSNFGNWLDNIYDLILINTIIPFPTQLLLCISISLVSIILKRMLIIKWYPSRLKGWKQ